MTEYDMGALRQRIRELELACRAADDQLAIMQRVAVDVAAPMAKSLVAHARAILTKAMESI